MKCPAFLCSVLLVFGSVSCVKKTNHEEKGNAAASMARPLKNKGTNIAAASLPTGTKLSYTSAPVQGPFIAITFDDGPVPANTPRLLDMLSARGIKATFFTVGRNVQAYPNIVRRIIADG